MHAPAASIPSRLVIVARDIKLTHTVFAMPFALLATFLAAASGGGGALPGWPQLTLIIVCMVLARTCAMAVNRWADASMDASNPRTARRAIPSGRLSRTFMLAVALAAAAGFIAAAGGFWLLDANPWPLILSPAVLAWLALYSFTKRFTALCHLFLGSALALSPIAAFIAVRPAALAAPDAWLLAAAVTCWVAGFDIIYALQDADFDREHRIYSLPAKIGVEPALWISRVLHALSLAAMVALALLSDPLSIGFAAGVAIVAALLLLEHAIVWRSKTRHIHMAFFTLNGAISLLLGGLGIADVAASVLR